jgi:hypothetical protein
MIRETKFLISRRPYAVDLGSLRIREHDCAGGTKVYSCNADAVWFRRRRGQTIACIGTLSNFQYQRLADTTQFLQQHTDGRSGGWYAARWDGRSYWSEDGTRGQQEKHMAVLQPMLAAIPEVPDGYDGWWRF